MLLDALEIERCRLLGWSAGGAYAVACCTALAERVDAATIVAGIAPPSVSRDGMDLLARGMLKLASASPLLVRGQLALLRLQAQQHGELLMRTLYSSCPACDRAVLADPAIRSMFIASYRSSTSPGLGGLVDDLTALARPWGTELDRIDGTRVRLVYGRRDRLTPAASGARLAACLGSTRFEEQAGVGHMAMWPDWVRTLEELAARP